MANPFLIDTGFQSSVLPAIQSYADDARNKELARIAFGDQTELNRQRLEGEQNLLLQRQQAQQEAQQRQFQMQEDAELRRIQRHDKLLAQQQQREQEQMARAEEIRKAKNQEILGLVNSGSTEDISNFIAQNPDYAQQLQSALTFKNEATQKNMVQSAIRIINGEDPAKVLGERAAMVEKEDGDPSDTLLALDLSPEELKKNAKLVVGLYGDEAQQKLVDQLLGVKTEDALKKEKLEAEIKEKKQKIEQKKKETEKQEKKSINLAKEAASLARDISKNDRLDSISGSKLYLERTPTGAKSQDLINKAKRLESLLTYENLSLMSGVLTDRDIQFLGQIGSGLNVTDDGILGSPEGVRKRLMEIANKIEAKLGGSETGEETENQRRDAPASAIQYLQQNPDAIDQFEAKYGYRPEGF